MSGQAALAGGALPSTFSVVEDERKWTATELDGAARFWEHSLQAAGLRRHEPVALVAAAGLESLLAIVALRRLGAAIVPLHPRLGKAETEELLEQSGARLLLAPPPPPTSESFGGASVRRVVLPSIGDPLALEPLSGPVRLVPAQFLLFTSGTEGRPKGVLLSEAAFRLHARASAQRIGGAATDVWLALLPWAHTGGLSVPLRTLAYGATLVLPPAQVPVDLDALLSRRGITHVSLVPTQLHRWIETRARAPAPPSLRVVLVGGGPASPELLRRARTVGLPCRYSYGLTETWGQVATSLPQTPLGSVGPPLSGIEIRIESDDGNPLLQGTEGRIQIRGPTLFLGYSGPEAKTTERSADGWFRTGDLGRLDAQGNLWITGRRSQLIVTGGEKVHPAEVEAVLNEHPAVLESCVVGLPHPEWGQQVAAAVVLRPKTSVSPDALDHHCRAKLAPFKCPRRVVVFSHLPRTPAGKVRSTEVRERLASASPLGLRVSNPSNP